jgi:plastocyanin
MATTRNAAATVVLSLIIAACTGGAGEVEVSLFEWSVEPSTDSVASGEVTFVATNDGGEAHELVIVKDVAPGDLPTDDTGKVVEDDLPEGAFIGEIEEFAAGETESATFDLAPGTYTLFCNIVEEEDTGEFESHFQEGMVTTIEVTG